MNMVMDIARQLTNGNGHSEAPAPDALSLLHSDHEEVEALFKTALADSTPPAAKKVAIAKVCFALTVHAKMEEKLFYPALRKAGKQKEKDSVLEAAEEHACVKDLIAKIKRVKGRDETIAAKVTVLKELVEHHVKEEESEMFDEARKVLGNKLQALGEEMQRFKDRAGAGNPTSGSVRKKRPAAATKKKSAARR
jgi:hemerythrin superfamily protein